MGCTSPGERAIQRADGLFQQGRFEEAAEAYASLPEQAGSWRPYGAWRAAVVYRHSAGDERLARAAYAACTERFPDDDYGYQCRVELGDLQAESGDHRGAVGTYRAALQARPRGSRSDHCLLNAGRSYLAIGEPTAARSELQELLRRVPGSPRVPAAKLLLARALDLEGRLVEAEAAYRALLDRGDGVGWRASAGLADVLAQAGRFDEADGLLAELEGSHPNPEALAVQRRALRERTARRGPVQLEVDPAPGADPGAAPRDSAPDADPGAAPREAGAMPASTSRSAP